MKKDVLVSSAWVIRNWKPIKDCYNSQQVGFSKYSMKRVLVEICRTECGYSENTSPQDIWYAIERKVNEVLSLK